MYAVPRSWTRLNPPYRQRADWTPSCLPLAYFARRITHISTVRLPNPTTHRARSGPAPYLPLRTSQNYARVANLRAHIANTTLLRFICFVWEQEFSVQRRNSSTRQQHVDRNGLRYGCQREHRRRGTCAGVGDQVSLPPGPRFGWPWSQEDGRQQEQDRHEVRVYQWILTSLSLNCNSIR
jgi:hypothetical protein